MRVCDQPGFSREQAQYRRVAELRTTY